MKKRFLEAIPELNLPEDLRADMEDVWLERVTQSPDQQFIRLYISSDHLLPKKQVYTLEGLIGQQLFPKRRVTIEIKEKYELSAQYTPPILWNLQKDSLLLECLYSGKIMQRILEEGQVDFPDEHIMRICLADNPIAREKGDEIRKMLEDFFVERCGQTLDVRIRYQNPERESYLEEQERLTALRVREVLKDAQIDMPAPVKEEQKAPAPEKAPAKAFPEGRKQNPWGAGSSYKGKGKAFSRKVHHDDVLYGFDFDEEPIPMKEILSEMGEVVVCGQVITLEERTLKTGTTLMIFNMTDFTDSITVKMFVKPERLEEVREFLHPQRFLKIKGNTAVDKFDHELGISSVVGIREGADTRTKREDHAEKKRVELHCHTKMSDMDGVSEVADILKQADAWGQPALAITDHGVVQAFTEAYHTKGLNLKIIYGVEGYLVDDKKELVIRAKDETLDDRYVVFDIETTGLSAYLDHIIEIGAVKVEHGEIVDRFSTFVNPHVPIPKNIEKLTSITDAQVMDAPSIETVLPQFLEFCEGAVIVAHNASFDTGFIGQACKRAGIPYEPVIADTLNMARVLLPHLKRFKLDDVAEACGVSLEHHHRAVDDAECTAGIFQYFLRDLKEKGVTYLREINGLGTMSVDAIRKMETYHVIILAKNDIGRINLYRLISMSHLTYYAKRPRIPKSELEKYREGLIIGSACEAGELFRAIVRKAPDEEIDRIVRFYDYLEIQPIGNNRFMIADEKTPDVQNEEDLRDLNRRVVDLGEKYNKPVVATGDVHFLAPEDALYRKIIMAGQGFKDADEQAPLFLRTTEEMLAEFEYLGSKKAQEVVVDNTNLIADMCEPIAPVRPDKCPPVIENSDKILRDLCYETAHEMYGPNLPDIVVKRLDKELNSIISNGYAVMYVIAYKLVNKSNEDGYLVGSRGSVGSSLAATMSRITEVNPLPPHYRCKKCFYVDFDSPEVKAFAGGSGCDMPDRVCPVCGEMLVKDGHDIPFETFLGFKGNKEPDIDLNFSGEYQSQAHAYTEVIFGEGHTFKAGTIGTLADKTAYGYALKYFEERNIPKRRCELDRIAAKCVGIRRTTGQHPGGIIVLPHGEEIHTFTPIQHPANDMTTDIVTTHFDYHSIDHNLLKLDILGHDDPTMIRMLESITDVNARTIPLDSKEVMSLFQDTSALGITPDDIYGCPLGALGVPEFGTDFAMQMLLDTKPKYFSDLVRIAGLAHGTDVWLGNAQDLIREGTATIQTAICCRDDIMVYLIGKGLDSEQSFTIMESVRKGKGLKPEWEEIMREHDVPEWYLSSCKKIKYMFPKAHAAAYVTMAWRIAWYKIFRPKEYYCAFFSIRASGFSYELMCLGRETLEKNLADYKRREDNLSAKEKDSLRDMRIVQEMYARGIEFLPLDFYRAKATRFSVVDGKIMPAINSIDGMGDKAAEAVEAAAKDGKFLSEEDFRQRTKVSQSVIDLMSGWGLFADLPKTNQLSLFDL
ncbi:MAG: PolC-type DNA polymerase III [Lachnospiraceae bacterium]|nr:PolC-type DNA polymerase III [Lachnospiraceae bacterium]